MDKEKYALVYTHKGIDICTLKVAEPPKDNLGYVVDSEYIQGEYNTLSDAVSAIDELF